MAYTHTMSSSSSKRKRTTQNNLDNFLQNPKIKTTVLPLPNKYEAFLYVSNLNYVQSELQAIKTPNQRNAAKKFVKDLLIKVHNASARPMKRIVIDFHHSDSSSFSREIKRWLVTKLGFTPDLSQDGYLFTIQPKFHNRAQVVPDEVYDSMRSFVVHTPKSELFKSQVDVWWRSYSRDNPLFDAYFRYIPQNAISANKEEFYNAVFLKFILDDNQKVMEEFFKRSIDEYLRTVVNDPKESNWGHWGNHFFAPRMFWTMIHDSLDDIRRYLEDRRTRLGVYEVLLPFLRYEWWPNRVRSELKEIFAKSSRETFDTFLKDACFTNECEERAVHSILEKVSQYIRTSENIQYIFRYYFAQEMRHTISKYDVGHVYNKLDPRTKLYPNTDGFASEFNRSAVGDENLDKLHNVFTLLMRQATRNAVKINTGDFVLSERLIGRLRSKFKNIKFVIPKNRTLNLKVHPFVANHLKNRHGVNVQKASENEIELRKRNHIVRQGATQNQANVSILRKRVCPISRPDSVPRFFKRVAKTMLECHNTFVSNPSKPINRIHAIYAVHLFSRAIVHKTTLWDFFNLRNTIPPQILSELRGNQINKQKDLQKLQDYITGERWTYGYNVQDVFTPALFFIHADRTWVHPTTCMDRALVAWYNSSNLCVPQLAHNYCSHYNGNQERCDDPNVAFFKMCFMSAFRHVHGRGGGGNNTKNNMTKNCLGLMYIYDTLAKAMQFPDALQKELDEELLYRGKVSRGVPKRRRLQTA